MQTGNAYSNLKGKRILVTGHTGFTGSWATIWLNSIGARVFGYSLKPETTPNLFEAAAVGELVEDSHGDIRDFHHLKKTFEEFKPDLILHLAAQPLVRRSYRMPRETFEINAQGTANVLEAALQTPSVRGVLCVTTDKVYKNTETGRLYKETDELGGDDPYSASKAAAEIVIASYRKFFSDGNTSAPLLTVARGGNIIGGGDWSEDRLVPDAIRAYFSDEELKIRNPEATRPWQHVLSLVEGYIQILSGQIGQDSHKFSQAFNLGPLEKQGLSVKLVLNQVKDSLPGLKISYESSPLHEAGQLALSSELASKTFGWLPKWSTNESVQKTIDWYKDFYDAPSSARKLCLEQIDSWNNSSSSN